MTEVPVRIVEVEDELGYMLKAALLRKNLNPDQKAALGLELADYEELRRQALARRVQNLPALQGPEGATLPLRGRTSERIAKVSGAAPRTVQDVITVREEDPDLFEQIKAGKRRAHAEAQEIRRKRKLEKLGQAGPTPDGLFAVIDADPPWRSDNPNASWAPERHYPTLAHPEIAAIDVPAAKDAILFLWAVNCQLVEALDVMAAWGFTYKANIVWVKPSPGIGRWVRNQHELLLIGVRGNFPCPLGSNTSPSVVHAARGRHSEKPEGVYELIERMYPDLPKLELFARGKARAGWTAWGNEVAS